MYVKMLFSLGSKLGFHVSKFPLQPIFFFHGVKCNLTELTRKNVCVPLRVCIIVLLTCLCIHLCWHSVVPSSVLGGNCASASIRSLHSLMFCCVHLCTCASACFELVLVTLYSLLLPTCAWIPHVHCSPVLPSRIQE